MKCVSQLIIQILSELGWLEFSRSKKEVSFNIFIQISVLEVCRFITVWERRQFGQLEVTIWASLSRDLVLETSTYVFAKSSNR